MKPIYFFIALLLFACYSDNKTSEQDDKPMYRDTSLYEKDTLINVEIADTFGSQNSYLIMPDEEFLAMVDTTYEDEFLQYIEHYYKLDTIINEQNFSEDCNLGYDGYKGSCAWTRVYDGGIKYYYWHCDFNCEVKYSEGMISFAGVEKKEVVELMNKLLRKEINRDDGYESSWNQDSTVLSPDGAGCEYKLNQSKDTINLSTWCGC